MSAPTPTPPGDPAPQRWNSKALAVVANAINVTLFIALVLGAIATANTVILWVLLASAWLVAAAMIGVHSSAAFGIRSWRLRSLIFAIVAAVLLVALGIWLQRQIPLIQRYSGVLISKDKPMADSPKFEIGPSGWVITGEGNIKVMEELLKESGLKIEVIDRTVKLSTRVMDSSGQIAKLTRNEWESARPSRTWDRNYNDHAVEVIDADDNVAVQIHVLADRIRIQGIWHQRPGTLTESVAIVDHPIHGPMMALGPYVPLPGEPGPKVKDVARHIRRMFKYPSERYLHQLADEASR